MNIADDIAKAYNDGVEDGMKYRAYYISPCDYCWMFENDRQYLISNGNGQYTDIYFEYCPMCGRKFPPMEN